MTARTFRVSRHAALWQVFRDEILYGEFLTRGDAVRAACFGARSDEGRGYAAQVLVHPSNRPISHFEPHFGE